jgi:hypothetical protein
MKKQRSPIPNKSNVEGWNREKQLVIQKEHNIAIKRMMIKIKIKNELEDNYEFFIEKWNWKENHFNKRTKESKEWGPN